MHSPSADGYWRLLALSLSLRGVASGKLISSSRYIDDIGMPVSELQLHSLSEAWSLHYIVYLF